MAMSAPGSAAERLRALEHGVLCLLLAVYLAQLTTNSIRMRRNLGDSKRRGLGCGNE